MPVTTRSSQPPTPQDPETLPAETASAETPSERTPAAPGEPDDGGNPIGNPTETAEAPETDKPAKLVEPGKPTPATEPGEATEPGKSTTEPTESGEPNEPAEPTEAAEDTVAGEDAVAADAGEGGEDAVAGEGGEDAEVVAPRGVRARVSYWRGWRGRYPRAARVVWWAATIASLLLVFGALSLPNRLFALHLSRFVRLPGEAIIGAAALLALPRRPRVALAALAGAALGALTILNVLDMQFVEYLGRPFDLVLDWILLDDAQSYVADSMGGTVALAATIGLIILVVLIMAVMALATVRLSGILVRDTRRATRGTLIAGTVWITCSVLGVQFAGLPVASDQVVNSLTSEARRVRATLQDEATFGKVARSDTFGATPAAQLVPDLRGKDVIFAFIESYGRSAVEDPGMAPGVDETLATSTAALTKAGFSAKSGWLTSATYGGSSWLGHSTTLSGLWVDTQQRYRTVMASDHLSLTKAFQKTGAWDTVGIMPGVQKGWPEQKFYGLDKVYNAFQMGYQGPKFSWSTMPDQYALEAFQRLEHGRTDRDKPLMSEIILTSSHQPWAPIPKMVGWDELGDGSVFEDIQADGEKASDVIADSDKSKKEYGRSIQYSVTALTQWLERYGTDDTVLVFLGDHQPISRVSGNNASRDVPVSIVAKDPKVLDKIAAWNWTDGLKPAHDAPVWKMSSFRDRFLKAYGSTPHPTTG
ncbi:CDP-alcohol phosphatidyltransferase [Streptomyces sp. NPDC048253]|uniref:CDP-alcohol phosphatidyltransferase n=1 Tax=Streptomyces sp. NPDC048253 TaxID=3365524 RepID=UPI0037210D6C